MMSEAYYKGTEIRKMGRPRTFDEDIALQAAINIFWEKGYDGTSMKDLTTKMGISGPSLYAAFGDKQALFLKAIDKYANNSGCAPLVAFENEPDIERAVYAFMESVVTYATAHESGARGCFLVSSVSTSAGKVAEVKSRLFQAIEATDRRLAKRFELEITKKKLPACFPVMERARLMFDLRQGHVFRARAGWSAKNLMQDLSNRVKIILA